VVLLSPQTAALWPSCGYGHLQADERGHLTVTDGYLRHFFERPEIAPVEESCSAERALYARLLDNPRLAVPAPDIDAMADADARDNYRVVLAFRDAMVEAGTIEACYLGLFSSGAITLPPLFIDQMAQIIMRSILDQAQDPLQARAAELLFREQTVTLHEGNILLGDSATVDMLGSTGGLGAMGQLLTEGGIKPRSIEMDVLLAETAEMYWPRNEKFDTVLDISFSRPGLDALCRVLEAWVGHFTGAKTSIQPVQKITDEKWIWHTGLDSVSSALLNDLYEDQDVSEERMQRLLSLFRLEFADPTLMRPDVQGRPVYLGLAMTEARRLRLKPQNLLVNLPYNQSM